MTSIINSLILSEIILLSYQKFRDIKYKILSFLICAAIWIPLLLLTDLNWWNIIILPACTMIGIFISLFIYPFTINEAFKNKKFEINDYYIQLKDEEKIGIIKTYGRMRDYETLLKRILLGFTSSKTDTNEIFDNLFSETFTPCKDVSKKIILEHVRESLNKVICKKEYLIQKTYEYPNIYHYVFNVYICLVYLRDKYSSKNFNY